jgi:E3 ubiquitin-protein transferase RMND5
VRTGRLDIADTFCAETSVPQPSNSFRAPHAELETLLAALRARDCEPACRWAEENQQALRRGRACLSELEFRLRALRFSVLLHAEGGREAALGFARTAFSEVDASDASQMDALKRMMSSLMCHPGALMDQAQAAQAWAGVEQLLTRAFSAARALPAASPLSVAVDAGEIVLPKLVKCRAVLEAQGTAWNSLSQLPVALDLPPRFDFHTLFACPVSREQCSAETNPAMLLPCGLALSRASIQKLTRANGRTFRCPYPTSAQCGSDVSVALCRPLFFS